MKKQQEIKTALERSVKTLKLKPAKGRVTRKATIRIVDGLTCEASERDWKMTSDVNRMLGGHESAPSPSTFARMALGSCLAMGYAMWFSRLDVPYDGIEVDVEADMDFSGFLGIDDTVPPGHKEMRVRVTVASPAPWPEIEHAMELADRYSAMRHVFTQPIPVKRELNVTGPDGKSAQAAAE